MIVVSMNVTMPEYEADWTDGSALGSDTKQGVEVMLNTGDAIVLPAGVAHCCLQSWEDYEYVGLYPEVRLGLFHHHKRTPCL